jgi:hypothetical protein
LGLTTGRRVKRGTGAARGIGGATYAVTTGDSAHFTA